MIWKITYHEGPNREGKIMFELEWTDTYGKKKGQFFQSLPEEHGFPPLDPKKRLPYSLTVRGNELKRH